jgi:DNA-binding response OmpR family regulator
MNPRSEAIRVLVIEDNAPDVMLIGESFREQDLAFEITHLRDGEEVLNRLKEEGSGQPSFHLIILDLNMPKLGGLEVLSSIRANREFATTPILVLTSSLVPNEPAEARRLGADRYMRKPSDLYEFLTQVGAVVRELTGLPSPNRPDGTH